MIRMKSYIAAALLPPLLAASVASAATSISNTLTGFTGNSTQAATQNALAAVGLGFTSTTGFEELPPLSGNFVDPTVTFDSAGAHFGTQQLLDGGRNFVRTLAADFANYSFVAEVTWVTNSIADQSAYFGMGTGGYGDFRIADYQVLTPAAFMSLEVNPDAPTVTSFKNDVGSLTGGAATATGLTSGANRLRISYDWYRKRMDVAIDLTYAGGPFVADVTGNSIDTLSLYRSSGWPSTASRIYFGGDDGAAFKDLELSVTSMPLLMGDFNGSGTLTPADWTLLRTNQFTNLSSLTPAQAFAKGDMNGDLVNDYTDFVLFKQFYEGAHGAPAFAALLAAPEPSTLVVMLTAGMFVGPAIARRAKNGR